MSRHARKASRIGAFVALVFLMTGCIKLNMNLGINSDNTVSGTVEFGVQKELLDLTGQSVEDLLGSDAPFPSSAPGVTIEPFDDGEFAGQQFTFEDLPIEQFNSGQIAGTSGATGGVGPDALQIARQGDTFVVTGVLDLSSGLSGATGPFGGTGGAQLLESADIRIAITFPGEVLQAPGGEIDGNTVTYVPEFGERLEINATGSAVDNGEAADVVGGSDSFLPLILIVGAVALALLIVLLLVVRGRKNEAAASGARTPSGFGEAGSAAAPVTALPGAPTATPPAGTTPTPPAGPTATPPGGAPTDAPPTGAPPPAPPMPPAPPPPAEG